MIQGRGVGALQVVSMFGQKLKPGEATVSRFSLQAIEPGYQRRWGAVVFPVQEKIHSGHRCGLEQVRVFVVQANELIPLRIVLQILQA